MASGLIVRALGGFNINNRIRAVGLMASGAVAAATAIIWRTVWRPRRGR